MKITEVRTIALSGATDDHGWPGGTDPNVQYNTLVEVRSDEGLRAWAVATPRGRWSKARWSCCKPHLIGEIGARARARQRKVRQSMFWLGRGGSVEHTISGLDIALWDLWGKALGQPVSQAAGRQLSRPDQALRVDPVRRSAACWPKSCTSKSRAAFAPSRWAGGRSAA